MPLLPQDRLVIYRVPRTHGKRRADSIFRLDVLFVVLTLFFFFFFNNKQPLHRGISVITFTQDAASSNGMEKKNNKNNKNNNARRRNNVYGW